MREIGIHDRTCRVLATAGCLLLAQWGHAGQFSYKSGSVMDARSCESELWYGDHDESFGAELTCRADAPFSVKLESGMPTSGPETHAVETKYQFRDHESHGYALGVTTTVGADDGLDRVTDGAVIVPFSVRAIPERLTVHLNAGAVHDRVSGDTDGYWGGAVELRLVGPVTGIFETFGTYGDDPTVHAGVQTSLMDDRLVLTVSYLDELEPGGADGWSAGAAFHVVTF